MKWRYFIIGATIIILTSCSRPEACYLGAWKGSVYELHIAKNGKCALSDIDDNINGTWLIEGDNMILHIGRHTLSASCVDKSTLETKDESGRTTLYRRIK